MVRPRCAVTPMETENDQSELGTWDAASLKEVVTLFTSVDTPWWIAGGVAIDLFVGHSNRTHKDIDVGILRRDVDRLRSALSSWEVFEARSGLLTPLTSEAHSQTNSLWCRRTPTSPWSLEVLLDHGDGPDWVFRRAPAIRRPLKNIARRTEQGIPYLAPEIQLLYKAKDVRDQDQTDFDRAVPLLDSESRSWLRAALAVAHSRDLWLAALDD